MLHIFRSHNHFSIHVNVNTIFMMCHNFAFQSDYSFFFFLCAHALAVIKRGFDASILISMALNAVVMPLTIHSTIKFVYKLFAELATLGRYFNLLQKKKTHFIPFTLNEVHNCVRQTVTNACIVQVFICSLKLLLKIVMRL